jgi:hypothetical protein
VGRYDHGVVLVSPGGVLGGHHDLGESGDLPARLVESDHDMRAHPACMQGGQAGPQPLRVVRARTQLQVAGLVRVPADRLGFGVRLVELLGRATRVVLQPVPGAHPAGHLAQLQPVDRRQLEYVADLHERAGEPVTLVELHGRGVPDDLDPQGREALGIRAVGDGRQQFAPDALAAGGRRDDHLEYPDVAQQQDVRHPQQRLAALCGAGSGLRDPADPPFTRHGHREVLAKCVDPPGRIIREIGRQGRVQRGEHCFDLDGRRGSRIPLAYHHPSSLQIKARSRKW